jgi:hypothetical protein
VSFAGGLPDLQATEARLLANQVDIGNAIKPYYGRTAGNRLTALLKDHILGAVALLQAAKSGDQTAIGKASAAWHANANRIADFLHDANPHAWSRTTMRAMMKTHLDQTLAEAQHRLGGDFAADIRDYDAVTGTSSRWRTPSATESCASSPSAFADRSRAVSARRR